ncbi:MAG: GNAT family N-acetyltransferase [Planctomycetes bacterium]|nr:GNAT family N-acetyltransferase [Planctomycetota bacterium]MCC7398613.1 GNAT family N-acetyltransferase [Planctomycetota bacterium]
MDNHHRAPRRILTTSRLTLRELGEHDADFVVRLLNDPDFLRCIGDRSVRSCDDARSYLRSGPIASYRQHGFGLFLVEDAAAQPLGFCGLLQRTELPDIDLGFAFLPQFRGRGYALEAAAATLAFAWNELRRPRVLAIVAADNQRSLGLLGKLGMRFSRRIPWGSQGVTLELHEIERPEHLR